MIYLRIIRFGVQEGNITVNDSLYEDYMRSVLGYQPMNNYQDTYNYNSYESYIDSCFIFKY